MCCFFYFYRQWAICAKGALRAARARQWAIITRTDERSHSGHSVHAQHRVAHIWSESVSCFRPPAGQGSGRHYRRSRLFSQGWWESQGLSLRQWNHPPFPAPLNILGSYLHPARIPIKQLRRLVFGNSRPLEGVINSWRTVFTVKAG